jgi:hypothetical protein
MSEASVESSIEVCFRGLYDERVQGRCDHKLIDIIIIAVCAMITGAGVQAKVVRQLVAVCGIAS